MQRQLAYQQYRQTQIQTATAENLILMLYQGAIKFAKQALIALENSEIEECHNKLLRVQDILDELSNSLNLQTGDIAINLQNIYEYMNYRLVQANVSKDPKQITEVIEMLNELFETWSVVVSNMKGR